MESLKGLTFLGMDGLGPNPKEILRTNRCQSAQNNCSTLPALDGRVRISVVADDRPSLQLARS